MHKWDAKDYHKSSAEQQEWARELFSKLFLKGKEGLSAWIRTTWLPYIQRVPERLREEFINEIVNKYIENHPLDNEGFVHVQMMRLEVEAENGNKIASNFR